VFSPKSETGGGFHDVVENARRRRLSFNANAVQSPKQSALKAGYLLKKSHIMATWRCRYFVLFAGRIEYFVDQHDQYPRSTIPLTGAEIHPPKKMTVNGVTDHWGLVVEPHAKHRERAFRIASEHTGEDGFAEMNTWAQLLEMASSRAHIQLHAAAATVENATLATGSSSASTTTSSSSSSAAAAAEENNTHTHSNFGVGLGVVAGVRNSTRTKVKQLSKKAIVSGKELNVLCSHSYYFSFFLSKHIYHTHKCILI